MPPKLGIDPEVEALRQMLSARDAPPIGASSSAPRSAEPSARVVPARPSLAVEKNIDSLTSVETAGDMEQNSRKPGAPHAMLEYSALQNTANQVRKELRVPSTSYTSASGFKKYADPGEGASAMSKYMWGSSERDMPQEELDSMINLPPSKRAEKAMQFVKFWQRPSTAMTSRTGPIELVQRIRETVKQNDWKLSSIHPHYILLTLLALFFFTSNYIKPEAMAFRPQGLFYYHNKAYDKCVSHYNICLSGQYKPTTTPLKILDVHHSLEGMGGPFDGCKTAYAFLLTTDNYLPGLLTTIHHLRKHATEPHDYVVIVTPEVTEQVRQVLYQFCVIVRETAVIRNPYRFVDWIDKWRKTLFTKLAVWMLVEYDKVLYVDADMGVMKSFDDLFQWEVHSGEISAGAYSYKEQNYLGTYSFLIKPSVETFDHLVKEATQAYAKKRKTWDMSDVGFLTEFFQKSWGTNPSLRWPWGTFTVNDDITSVGTLALDTINKTSHGFKFTARSSKPWLSALHNFKDDPDLLVILKKWWAQYYEMTDREIPDTIDMYSLLEFSEYDLYWRQMYATTRSRKWIGR